VVEFRHIFGMIIDDDGKSISLEEELNIFTRVINKIHIEFPLFQCRIIICSLKIIGKDHADKMIQGVLE
jgi:hypothetical protein